MSAAAWSAVLLGGAVVLLFMGIGWALVRIRYIPPVNVINGNVYGECHADCPHHVQGRPLVEIQVEGWILKGRKLWCPVHRGEAS